MSQALRSPEWNRGRWRRRETLLEPVSLGPVLPRWFCTEGYAPFTITVEGPFTGIVRVLGSNAPDMPLPGVVTLPQIGADFLIPGSYDVTNLWEWVGIWVPTTGSLAGLVGVYFHGAFHND